MVCDEGQRSHVVIGSVTTDFDSLMPADKPRTIIITDAKVHANNLAFINSYEHIVIGQGESSKTFVKLEEIYRQLLAMGADRSTFIIGMGGGIVTDITGFVASTYMRGVRFAFVPTTLLAQVDASVGGKNGVNLDGYKNIIGLISQPEFVLCDPELLGTLTEREFRCGLAEIIKAGIIGDKELFSLIENNSVEELRRNKTLLEEVILRSIRVKTDIVAHDQKECGERRLLNLGHTFAHAIEKSCTKFTHGEAVAVGMSIMCNTAVSRGIMDAATGARIKKTIERIGLPTESPVEKRKLLAAIKADKKKIGSKTYMVFPEEIGRCSIGMVSNDEIEAMLTDTEKNSASSKTTSKSKTTAATKSESVTNPAPAEELV